MDNMDGSIDDVEAGDVGFNNSNKMHDRNKPSMDSSTIFAVSQQAPKKIKINTGGGVSSLSSKMLGSGVSSSGPVKAGKLVIKRSAIQLSSEKIAKMQQK